MEIEWLRRGELREVNEGGMSRDGGDDSGELLFKRCIVHGLFLLRVSSSIRKLHTRFVL